MPYSHQTEVAIVDGLSAAGALTLSLVAVENDVVGHVAFSPVTIDGRTCDWYGIGPLAVRPDRQRKGVGQALMRTGLERIRERDARGCVLVGDPAFYGRFGFTARPELRLAGIPAEVFLALSFDGVFPSGAVQFHPAFDTEAS